MGSGSKIDEKPYCMFQFLATCYLRNRASEFVCPENKCATVITDNQVLAYEMK